MYISSYTASSCCFNALSMALYSHHIVEKNPNKLICEPGNEAEYQTGLEIGTEQNVPNGTEQIVPAVVDSDTTNINLCGREQLSYKINSTYADVVNRIKKKNKEKKVKFTPLLTLLK